ncbi:hypothetical protein BJ508DRAFT_412033 [Ascobolus immersus RN42]|uniref:Uncharacterized protein n=1 Tax=Ascobolus immersus RN42 TaxID=1160509 RepID=A0A3N4IGF3_ASCIM|nr:hypothetical protein BJ508DRAFT_412033 [Ascobolus immersus RN42]
MAFMVRSRFLPQPLEERYSDTPSVQIDSSRFDGLAMATTVLRPLRVLQTFTLFVLYGALLASAHDRCMAKFGNYTDDGKVEYTALGTAYRFNGTVRGLKNPDTKNDLLVITLEGCKKECGTKPEYHDWEQIQYTLTTWILPMLGVLLQLPFESNLFRASMLLAFRWLGNPVASFANVLWNMRVSARCAKLADMSEGYETMRSHRQAQDLEKQSVHTERQSNNLKGNIDRATEKRVVSQSSSTRPEAAKRARTGPWWSFWDWMKLQDDKIHGYINKGKKFRDKGAGRAYPAEISEIRDSMYILSVINQYEQEDKIERILWYALFTPGHVLLPSLPNTTDERLGQGQPSTSATPVHFTHGQLDSPSTSSVEQTESNVIANIHESDDANFLRIRSQPNPNKPLPETPSPSIRSGPPGPSFETYAEARSHLAQYIRRDRKHGVVLLLGATLWFFCSFGLSIYGGFMEDRGNQSRAHALGIGIFLSWLPMLSVASIVDRNPVHSDEVREELVNFLERVHLARIEARDFKEDLPRYKEYFLHFAGQARRRWHYGIAGRILALLERRLSYLYHLEMKSSGTITHRERNKGAWWEFDWYLRWTNQRAQKREQDMHVYSYLKRGWSKWYEEGQLVNEEIFQDSEEVVALRKEFKKDRQSWGPYSEKYMREQTVWQWTKDIWKITKLPPTSLDLTLPSVNRQIAFNTEDLWQLTFSIVLVLLPVYGAFTISYHTPTVGLGCRSGSYMIYSVLACTALAIEIVGWIPDRRIARQESRIIFRSALVLLEFANTSYLCYILVGQMVGSMNTCECRAVTWGRTKAFDAYILFGDDKRPELLRDTFHVTIWWAIATGMGGIPLVFGTAYSVMEWCLQSHLWSYDEKEARRGLEWVRRWRKATRWLYKFLRFACRVPVTMGFWLTAQWWRKSKYPFEWKPFNKSKEKGKHRSWEVPTRAEGTGNGPHEDGTGRALHSQGAFTDGGNGNPAVTVSPPRS